MGLRLLGDALNGLVYAGDMRKICIVCFVPLLACLYAFAAFAAFESRCQWIYSRSFT